MILYGKSYWSEIINFEALVRHGMIERNDLGLFQYADDPASALALLQSTLQAGPDEASPCFAHSRTRESKDR